MRLLLCSLLLVASSTAAFAGAGAPNAERLPNFRIQMPITDADLDRAEHAKQKHFLADDLASRLGIRNGRAELFNASDLGFPEDTHVTVDGRGAMLRVRW